MYRGKHWVRTLLLLFGGYESNLLISELWIAILQEKIVLFLNSRRSNKAPDAVAKLPLIELICLPVRFLPHANVARFYNPIALLCVDDAAWGNLKNH